MPETIAKVILNILTKHAYFSTKIVSDKGSTFVSHEIKEVTYVLSPTLKHATMKHAQTIGMLERSHTSLKQAIKTETSERRSLSQKNVSIAVLNYNTTYYKSIGCEPSIVFHGCIPYNVLDFEMGIQPQKHTRITSWPKKFWTEMIHQYHRKKTMQAYIKKKAHHDKKANAS